MEAQCNFKQAELTKMNQEATRLRQENFAARTSADNN